MVDVRLNGGSNSYSGTLQLRSLTPPTDWQDFSCSSIIYDRRVFAVACRMLGFENVASYPSKKKFSSLSYITNIILNLTGSTISNSGIFISMYRNCRGIETDINDCSGSYSYTTRCRYRYSIVCSRCKLCNNHPIIHLRKAL